MAGTDIIASMTARKHPAKGSKSEADREVGVMWRVSPEGRKALKTLAVQTDQTLQDLIDEAVTDLMRKYGKGWKGRG